MNRFISVNNLINDTGYSFSCDKKIFITKYFEYARIICASVNVSTFVDVLTDKSTATQKCAMNPDRPLKYTGGYSNVDENIVWKGTDGVESRYVSWSAGFDVNGFYRREVSFTENTVGSSLLRPGSTILATSKAEPLALYISSGRGSLLLVVYDFETNRDTLIKEIASGDLLNENIINSCKAYFGRFNSKKQHDIFINCPVMGLNNQVLFKSESYNNILQLPFGCLATDKLQIIDINGDKYSDILCTKSQLVIVNNKGDFIRSLPLEGIDDFIQFFANQNINFGDFNGDGMQDLLAMSSQKIAFGAISNKYTSQAITLNGLSNWCSSGNVVIADFDQDGKDDLLCQKDNQIFILLSRNSIPLSQSSFDSNKMVLTLDNFVFGLRGEHVIKNKENLVICNASNIEDTNTKMGCALIGRNSVLSVSTPILPSQSIRYLSINAHIKSSYDLFANDINVKNPENELINPESCPESDQEVFYDIVAPNSASVRYFNTNYTRYYYRDNLISTKTVDNSKHTFPHLITAGTCNNLYFNYTIITAEFAAEAKLQLFDDKNNLITNKTILDKHFRLFASGNITDNTTNADSVTFSYSGSITLKTPYKKTVSHCGEQIELADNVKKQKKAVVNTDTTCTLEKAKMTFDDTQSILALKREEVIKMNGYIHLGFGIFPFSTTSTPTAVSNAVSNAESSAQTLKNFPDPSRGKGDQANAQGLIDTLNRNGVSLESAFNNEVSQIIGSTAVVSSEITNINKFFTENNQYENSYSSVIFNTGLKMIAYIRNTDNCPKRAINFKVFQNYNSQALLSDISPYASFDNIEKVKLEAFGKSAKDILKVALLWSMYVTQKSQFFIFVDYLNTGNAIFRIPAFESNFKVISHSANEINTLIIAYRKNKDTLSIFKTYADLGGFRPERSIDIDLAGNGNIEYDIKKLTNTSFYLINHYKNNQGIFIQQYDFSLNKMGVEHNIQATPNQVCVDVYGNITTVIWLEKKDLYTIYMQVLQDNLTIKRMKLCEINGEVLLQDVQIQTSSQETNQYSLPNVCILIKIDNIPYLMSFDDNLRIANIKRINYPGQIISKDITNQVITNILQNNQAEIKQAIAMTENVGSCSNRQSYYEQKLEEITKQDFQNDNNFFRANSDAIRSFITNGGIISNVPLSYGTENGNIELSFAAYDILKAKSTLGIYNGNIGANSKLNLAFQHNSYLLNADSLKKNQLEDALEYINQGINRAIDTLSKNNNAAASATINKLLCKSTASPDTMRNLLISFKKALSAKIIYNFVADTALTKCQDQHFYPVYKEGSQINICPSYTNINLYAECDRILQLASLTKPEITSINKDAVLEGGAYSSNIVQYIYDIYTGSGVNIYNSCVNNDPFKQGNSIVHNLAKSIVVGMITTEPNKIITTTECSTMASNQCSDDGTTEKNNICLSDYIYANSMLYLFEHSTDYQINNKENCNAGCELSSPALSALLSEIRANINPIFTTNDLLNTTLLPNLTVTTTRSVNYTVESYEVANNATNQTNVNITRVENVTDVKELSAFNESAYHDIYDINAFSTVNFRDKNLSYMSSILQGSGFYEVRGQFFKMPAQKPYGLEMSLGRFENIKQLKVAAYNEKTILVAFSTQSLDTGKYNILVNILTQNNSRILNIYSSIDGNFDIRAMGTSQDFIVSYAEDYNTFVTKKYTITSTKIVEKFKTVKTLQNDKTIFAYISDYVRGLFDVVWNGYYKQTISTDGNLVNNINNNGDNIENYAATSNAKFTTVATQNSSHIKVDSFSIGTQDLQSSHALNITGWRLHNAQYVSENIAVFTLSNANSTLQRIVLDVTNKELLKIDSYYFIGQDFVTAKLVDTINNGTQLYEKVNVTEFDNLISAMHQCEYVLSGKNQNNPIYSTLMVKGNASDYLSVLKDKMPEKQSKALDESLAMHQDYSLNGFYKNLIANSAACIVDTGLKENFYSQMSGYADAVDFIEASDFKSIIGLV